MLPELEPAQRVSEAGSKARAATGCTVFASDMGGMGLYDVELDITLKVKCLKWFKFNARSLYTVVCKHLCPCLD